MSEFSGMSNFFNMAVNPEYKDPNYRVPDPHVVDRNIWGREAGLSPSVFQANFALKIGVATKKVVSAADMDEKSGLSTQAQMRREFNSYVPQAPKVIDSSSFAQLIQKDEGEETPEIKD